VLDGDQNSSMTIQQWGYVEWRPNFFDRHSIQPHCLMVTKYFLVAQKGMGGGHEMTIRTKGGRKKKGGKSGKRQ
jgi:hypothetical protein